ADHGREVGGQGHRVVLVEDACHVAEDRRGHQQGTAPHQEGRPGEVRPRGPPGEDQAPASSISAAGSSQEIWPPTSELNTRSQPVSPHRPPPAVPPPPPPTLPVSSPLSRPRPL